VSIRELQQVSSESPEAVLEELFLLLEEYGPMWYTVEHHNRAVAALLQDKKNKGLKATHPVAEKSAKKYLEP